MPESRLQEMDRQNIGFVEREWIASRIGMVAMILIVLMSLAGVFSVGPVSWAARSEPESGMTLRYEKLVRRGGPTDLRVFLPGALTDGSGAVSLWISDKYLELVKVENIVPQPDKATSVSSGVLYDFAVAGEDQGVDVRISITPHSIGPKTGSLGLLDGERIDFQQFFYP